MCVISQLFMKITINMNKQFIAPSFKIKFNIHSKFYKLENAKLNQHIIYQ